MIVKKQGGMTEFIPTPQEKRDSLIRDHTLQLFAVINERLSRVEKQNGLPEEMSKQFSKLLSRIKQEENSHIKLHNSLKPESCNN